MVVTPLTFEDFNPLQPSTQMQTDVQHNANTYVCGRVRQHQEGGRWAGRGWVTTTSPVPVSQLTAVCPKVELQPTGPTKAVLFIIHSTPLYLQVRDTPLDHQQKTFNYCAQEESYSLG